MQISGLLASRSCIWSCLDAKARLIGLFSALFSNGSVNSRSLFLFLLCSYAALLAAEPALSFPSIFEWPEAHRNVTLMPVRYEFTCSLRDKVPPC